MRNGSLRLQFAGVVLLAFLGLAGSAFAQQEGPLPPAPAAQPPAQIPTGQNPTATSPSAEPSVGAGTAHPTGLSGGAAAAEAGNATGPTLTPVSRNANARIDVPSGTHIPLVLHNAISTRSARPGDPVYFETLFPVMIDGRVAIPAGSYVSGEVTESKRPGRVKGRGELMIRLKTLILPNAYMVDLNAVPGG